MKGAGGGKRKSRKPARVEPDDRPRGYEARRMRQLWSDIDQARSKAGLGPTREEPTRPSWWEIGSVLERANAIANDAVARVTPAACVLLVTGSALLRQLPVVGRLAELVPMPGGDRRPAAPPDRVKGRSRASVVHVAEQANGKPNGRWVE